MVEGSSGKHKAADISWEAGSSKKSKKSEEFRSNTSKLEKDAYNCSDVPEAEGDRTPYLSSSLFFDVVLVKSHVSNSFTLSVPASFIQHLPPRTVPVLLRYRGKSWNIFYMGDSKCPRLLDWKSFAIENDLKYGDACIFELSEHDDQILIFNVHVLRGDLPSKLMQVVDSRGKSNDTAIVLE